MKRSVLVIISLVFVFLVAYNGTSYSATANLTVAKTGAGSGTVTSNPAGITCGTECTAAFTQDSTVTLTAAPDANSAFDGWTGDCKGKSKCSLKMTADKSVTAAFKRKYYTVAVTKGTNGKITPPGSGSPAVVKVSPDKSKQFNQQFVITPNSGYYISAITVDGTPLADISTYKVGSSRNYKYTFSSIADDAHSIAATFTALPKLTITRSGSGTVTTNPPGSSCGKDCKQFDVGTSVILTAKPSPKNTFGGWSEGGCSGTATCQITINGDTAVTATFIGASAASKGVAVDPYISGATFFEDVNNNGTKDEGEQVSTASDSNGKYSFSKPLTTGSTIIMDEKGVHNGVPYTGTLKTVVGPSGTLVTSPLTTLLANGWTAEQVAGLLNDVGLTNITVDDLIKDPMADIASKDSESLTAAQLEKIQASMSVYCFLSIMDGVITLAREGKIPVLALEFADITSGFDLTYDKFIQHPNWKALLSTGVALIKDGLSVDIISSMDAVMEPGTDLCTQNLLPAPPAATAGDVIRGSVAISNYVVPKVIESCMVLDEVTGFPRCDYAPASADYEVWRFKLGENFYVMRTKTNGCIKAGLQYYQAQFFPNYIPCSTTFVINASGEVECSK